MVFDKSLSSSMIDHSSLTVDFCFCVKSEEGGELEDLGFCCYHRVMCAGV